MSSTIVLPLASAQVPAAAAVLVRAFQDEPLSVYLLPDAEERAQACLSVFTAWLRAPDAVADVLIEGDQIAGVALWGSANATEPSTDPAARERVQAPETQGWSPPAQDRFRAYFGYMGAVHARLIPEAHWTLSLLGVEPTRQGRGYGTGLIADRLAAIRAAGLSCYLTTGSARNVAFYRRVGFHELEQGVVPGTELPFWALRRD